MTEISIYETLHLTIGRVEQVTIPSPAAFLVWTHWDTLPITQHITGYGGGTWELTKHMREGKKVSKSTFVHISGVSLQKFHG